ncbi:Hsp70 family protein [soil metagenome]
MTELSFLLAIDLGTSRIAAATARVAADGSILTAPFALGRKSDSIATVVFVGDDGDLAFGDVAERRGVAQPERLIREFKRSIGDEVPLMVGGRALRAEYLYAQTIADVIRIVAEREGAQPAGVSLTHPTAWGRHRIELVRSALRELGIEEVDLITEPEAAARHYEASRELETGETLAVYDLGGGTFDSVILRKEIDGSFDIIGAPVGIDNLGGADFDDAVMRHVLSASGLDIESISVDDVDTRLALSQLRRECIDAKEALSFDSETTIPVLVPPERTTVRLTRSEFEDMITASVDRTVDALDDALDSAGLEPERLESILLIGGSSRIPRVAQRLSERFDRPIAIDADPKAAIALGAARTALIRLHDREMSAGERTLAVMETAPDAAIIAVDSEPNRLVAPVALTPKARRSSPFLLAGAAVTIATAIVFASTVSAGSDARDLFNPAASNQTSRPTPSATADSESAEPAAPAEAIPVTDPQTEPQTRSGSTNPRRTATQEAATKSASTAQPAPNIRPTTPPTGTTTPSAPAPQPEPTVPAPEPEPTVPAPEPEPTVPAPEPEPTVPAPEP